MREFDWMSIRDVMRISPQERSQSDIEKVFQSVKDVGIISKLTPKQGRDLCGVMSVEEFQGHTTIFNLGETGDKFYIIVMGAVQVLLPKPNAPCPTQFHLPGQKCDCPGKPMEQAAKMQRGATFGDLALQDDAPRSATIMTLEPTLCLVVKRHNYQELVGSTQTDLLEKRFEFLLSFDKIAQALETEVVTKKDLLAMAALLQDKFVGGHEVLVREGDPVENLVFVITGSLSLVRHVELDKASAELKSAASRRPGSVDPKAIVGIQEPQTARQLAENLARAVVQKRREERRVQLAKLEAATNQTARKSKKTEFAHTAEGLGKLDEDEDSENSQTSLKSHGSQGSPGEGPKGTTWKKLRDAFSTARIMTNVMFDGKSEVVKPDFDSPAAGDKNVQHFVDVAKARELVTAYNYNQAVEDNKSSRQLAQQQKAVQKLSRRSRLFVIGHLGPGQYFGDEQICGSGLYPCTIVGDPVADVYLMSKHDIVRRLPKKLFNTLFAGLTEHKMQDAQLLQLLRQNDRWINFRKDTADRHVTARPRGRAEVTPMPLRDKVWTPRMNFVDRYANMEFLGLAGRKPPKEHPIRGHHKLTVTDEVTFSDSPAAFVRKYEFNKRDKDLDVEHKRQGMKLWQTHDRPPPTRQQATCEPSGYVFERMWGSCGNFPELDLDLSSLERFDNLASGSGGSQERTSTAGWLDALPTAAPASARGSSKLSDVPRYGSQGVWDDQPPSFRSSPTKIGLETPLSMAGNVDVGSSRPSSRASPSPARFGR